MEISLPGCCRWKIILNVRTHWRKKGGTVPSCNKFLYPKNDNTAPRSRDKYSRGRSNREQGWDTPICKIINFMCRKTATKVGKQQSRGVNSSQTNFKMLEDGYNISIQPRYNHTIYLKKIHLQREKKNRENNL